MPWRNAASRSRSRACQTSSAVKLADDILHHGAVARYQTFLQSGGSDYPIEELKAAGVDLTKKESILASLDVFEQYVNELDQLLK